MTAASLRHRSCKDLAQMARTQGVAGWHSMRKDELVKALVNQARRKPKSRLGGNGHANPPHVNGNGITRSRGSSVAQERLTELRANLGVSKQLGAGNANAADRLEKDRLVVMVRDPYWLHAYWEISPRSVDRAQSALGQHWHGTTPILRVFRVSADGTAALHREISIHGGVNHWYVDVQNPPQQYRMEIGYLTAGGQF
jgi:hypothetical protein